MYKISGYEVMMGDVEFCNCGNLMQFEQRFEFECDGGFYAADGNYTIDIFKTFTCPACDSVTIIIYSSYGNYEVEAEEIVHERLLNREYSRKVLYAPSRSLHTAIPQPISEVLNEAESVISSSPRASFILCRAVLEEICNDFNIPAVPQNSKGKNSFISLNRRLFLLFEQEKLPEELKNIIQGIKNFGNEGAHSTHLKFSQQVNTEDAENLVILVNYVVERLYVDKYRREEAERILSNLKVRVFPKPEIDK